MQNRAETTAGGMEWSRVERVIFIDCTWPQTKKIIKVRGRHQDMGQASRYGAGIKVWGRHQGTGQARSLFLHLETCC